jgi:hypothetical protein
MLRPYLVPALLILAGCGESTNSGVGLVEGFLADPQRASFAGDLNGGVQVSISEDGSTWLDLGSLNGITAPLQTSGVRTTVHGEQNAPVGTYSWVRLTMSGVRARLNGGSSVGNTFLSGNTEIPLGGSDDLVEVTLQIRFEVVAGESQRRFITFTMNSSSWMTEAALQASMVDDVPIEAAVTAAVTVESGS